MIYRQLFDHSPLGLPPTLVPTTGGLPTITLDPEVATALQTAAAEANEEFGRR